MYQKHFGISPIMPVVSFAVLWSALMNRLLPVQGKNGQKNRKNIIGPSWENLYYIMKIPMKTTGI